MIKKNELKVGLFVVIPMLFLFLLGMFKLGYSLANDTKNIYLKIDSIEAVGKGTKVVMKGYPIGKVEDVQPVYQPALYFLALMKVKKDIQLYENCSAVIQNQNIIGDTVIEIKNPETKGALLQDGDVVEGLEYANLQSLLQDASKLLRKLVATVDVLEQISKESRYNLKHLISSLSSSGTKLNTILEAAQTDVVAILKSFRITAKTMKEISKELKKHPVKFLFKDDK